MQIIIFFYVFILGTLIGSFLNVVILRYNTGKNIFGHRERSVCFSCSRKLPWYDLIPVFSFVCLRAKCRGCKSLISWQYPAVEILTGLIFAGIFWQLYSQSLSLSDIAIRFFVYALVWSVLIVITVYDLRHKIIPDAFVFAFIALSLVSSFFFPYFLTTFANGVVAGILFFCFFAGLWLVSRGRWLGFGDAKLILGVGFLLGLDRGLTAVVLSFWIGAVVSLVLLAFSWLIRQKVIQRSRLRRRFGLFTMKSEIPFAPFIILGTLIAFFFEIDVIGLSKIL